MSQKTRPKIPLQKTLDRYTTNCLFPGTDNKIYLCVSPAHSPDNLFLGFVVDKAVAIDKSKINSLNETTDSKNDKPIGLLYAKDALYLKVS